MFGNFFRLQENISVKNKNGHLESIYLSKDCINCLEGLMSIGLDVDYLTSECDRKRGDTSFEIFLTFTTQRLLDIQKCSMVDVKNKRFKNFKNIEFRIWKTQANEAIQKAEAYFANSGPKAQ